VEVFGPVGFIRGRRRRFWCLWFLGGIFCLLVMVDVVKDFFCLVDRVYRYSAVRVEVGLWGG